MRSPVPFLIAFLLGLALLPGLGQSETNLGPTGPGAPDADPVSALDENRLLLDRWRHEPDHFARLQKALAAFWKLPADERQRLRQLDQDIHRQNSEDQKVL